MDLLQSILNAKNGAAVTQLARQYGLREDQAQAAVQNLVPALAGGLQRNISQGGLESLLGALTKGGHTKYVDDPSTLSLDTTREDGNGILGHIFGSKDVSRKVAAQAASRTGISESILKQMLPSIAALAMGALGKQTSQRGEMGGLGNLNPAAAQGGLMGMLTPLLDRDRDGSILDDIMGSFFKK